MGLEKKDKRSLDEQQLIRELALLLIETGLSEIEIEREDFKVRVARTIQATENIAIATPYTSVQTSQTSRNNQPDVATGIVDAHAHPGAVKSPMVGTVYLAPEPDAPHFVTVGSKVSEGQTLLIIEAMKTMNHIPAPKSGVVKQIFVENSHPVEFGELLLIID